MKLRDLKDFNKVLTNVIKSNSIEAMDEFARALYERREYKALGQLNFVLREKLGRPLDVKEKTISPLTARMMDFEHQYVTRQDYSYEIPKQVRTIQPRAFRGTKAIKKVIGGQGLTTIGKGAFQDSGVQYIALSEGVRNISDGAFADCSELKEVHLPASVKRVGNQAFRNCKCVVYTKNRDISFPTNEMEFYKAHLKLEGGGNENS